MTRHIHTLLFAPVAALLVFTQPACAQEEQRAGEERIYELLVDAKAVGEDFEQTFGDPRGHESAPTSYWQGNQGSFGRWKVADDRYCSQWPPNEAWSCYDVFWSAKGGQTTIVWVSSGGERYVARMEPKD